MIIFLSSFFTLLALFVIVFFVLFLRLVNFSLKLTERVVAIEEFLLEEIPEKSENQNTGLMDVKTPGGPKVT